MSNETAVASASASASNHPEAKDHRYYLEILFISLAGLLLEISYTRIISFKLYYYFTYFVIGLALLGLGTGGVMVAVSGRIRRASTEAVLMWSSLLGAVSVGVGYLVVARVPVDTLLIWEYGTRSSFDQLTRLLVVCFVLFAPFVAAGVVIATLFGRRTDDIGRLYFADLIGAGLACAVVVTLLAQIGAPATVLLAGLVMALLGLAIGIRNHSRLRAPAVVLSLLLAVGVVFPDVLPEQRADRYKTDATDVDFEFSSWSPVFRIDVQPVPPGDWLIYHDGSPGSGMVRWDGSEASLSDFDFDSDPRVLPFTVSETPPEDLMIIGAAGGREIVASLYFDAAHIDAVELNPVTYSLVTDRYADKTGRLAENPRVNYVNGDGRTYLARTDSEYDLVWYPAPDSYAATNAATSGAFVLSESYLYTSEAIVDSLEHLSPDGAVVAQFGEFDYVNKPNRTTRYVATARHALAELGIEDPSRHIVVSTAPEVGTFPLSTILVKRTPFTSAELDRYLTALEGVDGATLEYAPGHTDVPNSVTDLMTTPSDELDTFFDNYPYDIQPVTDNKPFFWHFAPLKDVISQIGQPIDQSDFEDSAGERVLILLLGVAVLMATVFLLLPFISIRRTWLELPRKPTSALYFACLGLGFLFFEITLIQRLVLFLGYPTYSLTVTLASMLIFTGVGALLSERIGMSPNRLASVLLTALTALTLFYAIALAPLTDNLLSLSFALRVMLAFAVLAPLGVCLGMFMPLGLGAVAKLTTHEREYVAWGWAINGFASVVGAVVATLLAMTWGFDLVLFVALGVYIVAVFALRSLLGAVELSEPTPA